MTIVNKLTSTAIDNHIVPAGLDKDELCCNETKGFVAVVRASRPGRAPMAFKWKDPKTKKTRRIPLGKYPETDPDTAREKAIAARAEVDAGRDPSSVIQSSTMPTVKTYITETWLPDKKLRVRDNTYKMLEGNSRRYIIPALGESALNAVTKADVVNLGTTLRQRGLRPASANRCLATLRSMYSYATDMGIVDVNPTKGARLYKEPLNTKHLSNRDLARLLKFLRKYPNRNVAMIVEWLCYTGARVQEVLKAKVADLDMERNLWTVTALHNKNGRPRVIPLPTRCLQLIEEIAPWEHQSGYLFESPSGTRYKNIHKSFGTLRKKVIEELDMPHFTLHSARHTFATIALNSGVSAPEISRLLGHANIAITLKHYAHLQTQTLVEAANHTAAAIDAAVEKAS